MKNDKYKRFTKKTSSKSSPTSIPYTVYLNKIRSGVVESVYILFGADHPGKNEFINELKLTNDCKLETFVIAENEKLQKDIVNTFLSKAFTSSLWGDKMILVLYDFQNLLRTQQKEILDRITTIPKNYFANIVIESKYRKDIQTLLNECNFAVMNFYAPDERILIQYIYEMAKAIGLVIDTESSKILLDMIGNDFVVINQELEKVKTFLGDKTRITPDIILYACGFSKESSIEDLLHATFDRNLNKSLSNLFRLRNDRVFPSIIVSSMANTCFQLLQIKLGAGQKSIGSGKIGQKRFGALENQSRSWTSKELTNFLLELAKIDKKIKTGYPEPFVLIESLLVKSGKDYHYSNTVAV
jgi:DNA polymerase-3 subunit delta